MNCDYCGSKLFEQDRDCPRCGGPIGHENKYHDNWKKKNDIILGSGFYNTSDTLRVSGWSQASFIKLVQNVCAHNGGLKTVLVCDISALYLIMPNDSSFRYDIYPGPKIMSLFGVEIIPDSDLFSKLCSLVRENGNVMFCISVDDYGKVKDTIGIMDY